MNSELLKTESYKKICAEYAQWLVTLDFATSVVYCFKNSAAYFFEWMENQNIPSITLLSKKHISDYFAYLQHRPNKRNKGALISTQHLNHHFTVIDKLLEFLLQRGEKNIPAPSHYRVKHDRLAHIRKIKPFTQVEIKTLYNCIEKTYPKQLYFLREAKHEQLKLIFTLYYTCGLSANEGYQLRIDDIDFDRKTIFIQSGENHKERIIPMNTEVYGTLHDYIDNFRNRLKLPHRRLFIYGKQLLNKSLQHLQSGCLDENIKAKRLSLRTLRHSKTIHLLQEGMSAKNITRFLGNRDVKNTGVYKHLL